jgi:hypothetical protein
VEETASQANAAVSAYTMFLDAGRTVVLTPLPPEGAALPFAIHRDSWEVARAAGWGFYPDGTPYRILPLHLDTFAAQMGRHGITVVLSP